MGSAPVTPSRGGVMARLAGAPICWGVCEVPGWGRQLDPDTVLPEMSALGFVATEYGPDGFLPDLAQDKAATLARHGLRAVGQFVPLVLHDRDRDPLPEAEAALGALLAADAGVLVVAAVHGGEGYDSRPVLGDEEWDTLLANLDRISDAAAAHGLVATLHPHVGTMVETGAETDRVLGGSRILLCLDTGHLLIGGGDPVAVTREHPDRIGHIHLKDVRRDLAEQVRSGGLTYTEAVRAGMYVPLGAGDVDIAAIVTSLETAGYRGWYVLEQDTVLPASGDDEAESPDPGARPVSDVRRSLEFLRGVAGRIEAGQGRGRGREEPRT